MSRSLPPAHRELGSVYTPPAIAAGMVREGLDRWYSAEFETNARNGRSPCRILDPACGDGAFLVAVFDELVKRRQCPGLTAKDRLQVIRDQIFGVDIDPPAVSALQSRLLARIDPAADLASEATFVISQNIRCGDSLTGPDFSAMSQRQLAFPIDTHGVVPGAISWAEAFPAVATAGGFDVVVGNPPYLRERNAKALFDKLAACEIGKRWREARMDLWFYFLHRSLDLLRPRGFLSLIVNSYWMSSRGAGRMIARLERETLFEEIQLLNDAPVFKSIAGRHMIFRLRKRVFGGDCNDHRSKPIDNLCRVTAAIGGEADRYLLSHDELFQSGRLVVAKPAAGQSLFCGRPLLAADFETRQGIAENPPCITRSLFQEFSGRYQLGAGVFVLAPHEIAELKLPAAEKQLLRPYYDTRAIGRFRFPEHATHQLLYLTRRTAPRLEVFPTIAGHLEQYRPILERRREVQLGRCAWWHLHWPRVEGIFLGPKVFSVQMGKRPQFVFCPRPAFVGFSVNLILPGASSSLSLEVLTGILNSDLAFLWFERHAKRRGVNVEINAHLLRQFPLPGREPQIEDQVSKIVFQRHATTDELQATRFEQQIESLVKELYGRP